MFDWLMARAIAAELQATLEGGRVQQVYSLESLAVGFEVYAHHARHYLLASAAAADARLHRVGQKMRAAPPPVPTFVQLLQKYAEGAFIDRIRQPHLERIIEIEFDHREHGVSTLIVEVMGRRSNLILVDAGRLVLDAAKRVSPEQSRVRPIQPRRPYQPPPPQDKVDPQSVTPPQVAEWMAEWGMGVEHPTAGIRHASPDKGAPGISQWVDLLTGRVAGVSPQLAREVVSRATRVPKPAKKDDELRSGEGSWMELAAEGDRSRHASAAEPAAVARRVSDELRVLVAAPPEPSLGLDEGEIVACAPYRLSQFPETRPIESASAALEAFHGRLDAYNAVKEPLRRALLEMRERLVRKRDSLQRQVVSPEEIEKFKTNGEFVLGLSSQIEPGQRELRVDLGDGAPLVISLDPKLNGVENAQEWFRRYQQAKGAAAQVPARLKEAENEIEYLDQVLADVDLAESRAEIEAAQDEAVNAGFYSTPRLTRSGPRLGGPREFLSRDGFPILVGRNAEQNAEVTFHRAERDDVWLHARGVGGAHVVILSGGRAVPETTVAEAAALAAHFSRARSEAQVDVAVTLRKYVRPVRGGPPGLVTLQNERTVRVAPAIPA